MALNKRGHEVLDSTPVALPVGFKRPLSLNEQIRRLVKNELSNRAAAVGAESFEEADDFDCEDDFDPKSPYEEVFDPGEKPGDANLAVEETLLGKAKVAEQPEVKPKVDPVVGQPELPDTK